MTRRGFLRSVFVAALAAPIAAIAAVAKPQPEGEFVVVETENWKRLSGSDFSEIEGGWCYEARVGSREFFEDPVTLTHTWGRPFPINACGRQPCINEVDQGRRDGAQA